MFNTIILTYYIYNLSLPSYVIIFYTYHGLQVNETIILALDNKLSPNH